jgi:DNA-binding IclR family transcriptional regulator
VEPLLVILALGAVVLLVGWPFLRTGAGRAADQDADRIADLLAARESTYRQIRELELDHRTGKLSREDFRAQDRALRARAIEILRELDTLGVSEQPAPVRDGERASSPA